MTTSDRIIADLCQPFYGRLLCFSGRLVRDVKLSPGLFPAVRVRGVVVYVSYMDRDGKLSTLVAGGVTSLRFVNSARLFPLC